MKDNLNQSSAVNAVVDFYGPVEFYTMDSEYTSLGVSGTSYSKDTSFESKYLGQVIGSSNVQFNLIDGAAHMDPAFYTDANLSAIFSFLKKSL